jgi:hypothetical protein
MYQQGLFIYTANIRRAPEQNKEKRLMENRKECVYYALHK